MKFTKFVPAAAALSLTAVLIAPSIASAGWIRGSSDLDTSSNDVSLCEDELTFESEYRQVTDNIIFGDGYVPGLGNPWPRNGGVDELRLYGTAFDAENGVNPIATVTIPLFETGTDGSIRTIFEGQGTIPTPAGYENGDQIFVSVFNNFQFPQLSLALTIGDAVYNCVVPPANLDFTASASRSATRINATFDSTNVDRATVMIATDNGTAAPANRSKIRRSGIARFTVDSATIGLSCDTTKIIVTASTLDGQPLRGEQPFTDPRCIPA